MVKMTKNSTTSDRCWSGWVQKKKKKKRTYQDQKKESDRLSRKGFTLELANISFSLHLERKKSVWFFSSLRKYWCFNICSVCLFSPYNPRVLWSKRSNTTISFPNNAAHSIQMNFHSRKMRWCAYKKRSGAENEWQSAISSSASEIERITNSTPTHARRT